jgi:hypothetical protein
MTSPCWRHYDPDPFSKIDRIRQDGDKYVAVMKNGSSATFILPKEAIATSIANGKFVECKDEPLPQISDEELSISMLVFIEQYGERMIRAAAAACRKVAEKADREINSDTWNQAAALIDQAAEHLEEN